MFRLFHLSLCVSIFALVLRALNSTAADISDDELVELVQAGDMEAFNRLVGRHQRLMYNIAYRIMGSTDSAADVTQDAFVAAYRNLQQYKGGSFRAWMSRIVKNKCYDLLRYEKRRPAASLDALLVTTDEPPVALQQQRRQRPDSTVMQAEVADWLQAVIMELPEDQRMTLVMADVHGYSYEEIADATDAQLGTVKSRLFRARRKVRDALQAQAELLPPKYRLEP